MTYNTKFETRHLPPDVQDLVDTIINGIVALASRVNSNSVSMSSYRYPFAWCLRRQISHASR